MKTNIVHVTLKSEINHKLYEHVTAWDFVERGNKWFLFVCNKDSGKYSYTALDDILRITIEEDLND